MVITDFLVVQRVRFGQAEQAVLAEAACLLEELMRRERAMHVSLDDFVPLRVFADENAVRIAQFRLLRVTAGHQLPHLASQGLGHALARQCSHLLRPRRLLGVQTALPTSQDLAPRFQKLLVGHFLADHSCGNTAALETFVEESTTAVKHS